MKKLITLVSLLISLFAVPVLAEDITVLYNGLPMTFTDATPTVVEGRVLLPLRAVFEQMNASVSYDSSARIASARLNGREIEFSPDSREILSGGETVYVMDVLPTVTEGRILVPVRAVSEAGGLDVGWDEAERTVSIISKEEISAKIKSACEALSPYEALLEGAATVYSQSGIVSISSADRSAEIGFTVTGDGTAKRCFAEADGAEAEIIVTNEALFVRTVLSPLGLDEPVLINTDGKWLTSDWSELEAYISGSDNGVLCRMAAELIDRSQKTDLVPVLEELALDGLDINSAASARSLAERLDILSGVFSDEVFRVGYNSDQSAYVRLDVAGGLFESLFGCEGSLSHSASYSCGVEIKGETTLSFGSGSEQTTVFARTRGELGSVVEKIILPIDTAENLVDALYSLSKK